MVRSIFCVASLALLVSVPVHADESAVAKSEDCDKYHDATIEALNCELRGLRDSNRQIRNYAKEIHDELVEIRSKIENYEAPKTKTPFAIIENRSCDFGPNLPSCSDVANQVCRDLGYKRSWRFTKLPKNPDGSIPRTDEIVCIDS